MCRKNHLLGCAVAALGLGLLIGYCADSALVSIWGGTGLVFLGICLTRENRRF